MGGRVADGEDVEIVRALCGSCLAICKLHRLRVDAVAGQSARSGGPCSHGPRTGRISATALLIRRGLKLDRERAILE